MEDEKHQRSVFEDRFVGNVIKKKRRRPVVVDTSPKKRARKPPVCSICSGSHYARSCGVGK